jgi:hypothetical protein
VSRPGVPSRSRSWAAATSPLEQCAGESHHQHESMNATGLSASIFGMFLKFVVVMMIVMRTTLGQWLSTSCKTTGCGIARKGMNYIALILLINVVAVVGNPIMCAGLNTEPSFFGDCQSTDVFWCDFEGYMQHELRDNRCDQTCAERSWRWDAGSDIILGLRGMGNPPGGGTSRLGGRTACSHLTSPCQCVAQEVPNADRFLLSLGGVSVPPLWPSAWGLVVTDKARGPFESNKPSCAPFGPTARWCTRGQSPNASAGNGRQKWFPWGRLGSLYVEPLWWSHSGLGTLLEIFGTNVTAITSVLDAVAILVDRLCVIATCTRNQCPTGVVVKAGAPLRAQMVNTRAVQRRLLWGTFGSMGLLDHEEPMLEGSSWAPCHIMPLKTVLVGARTNHIVKC